MNRLSFLVLILALSLPVGAMASGVTSLGGFSFSYLNGLTGDIACLSGACTVNKIQTIAVTPPASGQLVGTTDTQTLTNKTLTNPVINGGSAVLGQVDAHAAVSSGSIATVSTTPGGTMSNITSGDLFYVTTGSGDAVVECVTAAVGVCSAGQVALVYSGSSGYSTGSGQATSKKSCTNSGCTGLTVNATAVGLTPAQVSNTQVNQYGQGTNTITNYLPTAMPGYSFITTIGQTEVSNYFALNNNSGTLNGASGDVMYLTGVAGTAGSSHGLEDAAPAVGDEIVCKTAQIGAASWAWFCSVTAGPWAAY